MNKLLASCLVLLASAASAATPLENAVDLAARLGATVAAPESAAIAAPASQPASEPATPAAVAGAPAVKISAIAGASGAVSGYASATGNGMMNCSGGPRGGGWMGGWINLRADVSVTTDDGASAQFPVTGSVYLSGSCQGGSGFVNGNAMLNGSGSLYKAGRYIGNVSLSGNAFINQYVNGPFAWITQQVYLSGRYDESTVSAK